MVRFAYLTGWRMHDEVLPLQWRQVDFAAGEIRFDGHHQERRRSGLRHERRPPSPAARTTAARPMPCRGKSRRSSRLVFYRDGGERIVSFYKAWKSAARKAGVPGLIPHDMRRSRARNMIRRGVSQKVAQELMGHRTSAMFDRYRIVSTTELHEGASRIDGILGPTMGPAKVRNGVRLAAVIGSRKDRSR